MKIIVKPHDIEIQKTEKVNENEYNITKCEFEFSEEYTNDLVKVALFTNSAGTYKQIIFNNECNIPAEILGKNESTILGVYAYKEDEELVLRYSPEPIKFFISKGSYIENAENSEPITPTDKEQIEQAIANLEVDKQDKLITGNNIVIKDGVISAKERTWKKVRTITVPSDDYKGQEIDGVTFGYSVSSDGGIKSITFSTDENGELLSEHSITGAIIKLTPTENININQGFVSINSNGLNTTSGYALDYIVNIKTTALRWFEYSLKPYFATMTASNPGNYRFPTQYTHKQINDLSFGGFEAASVLGEGTKFEIWMYGYWE